MNAKNTVLIVWDDAHIVPPANVIGMQNGSMKGIDPYAF